MNTPTRQIDKISSIERETVRKFLNKRANSSSKQIKQ